MDSEKEYYESGRLSREIWDSGTGEIRTVEYEDDEENTLLREVWYLVPVDGGDEYVIGRIGDNPSVLTFDKIGRLESVNYYLNGDLGRVGSGPSYVGYSGGNLILKMWYRGGKKHREGDLPAEITYYPQIPFGKKFETWFVEDAIFRSGGKPAQVEYENVVFSDGSSPVKAEEWYENEILTRKVVYERGTRISELWYMERNGDSENRRLGGEPAKIDYFPTGEIRRKIWIPSRGDEPSIVEYYRLGGAVKINTWTLENNRLGRRGDLPAREGYYVSGEVSARAWYTNFKFGRDDDQPSKIQYTRDGKIKSREWWRDKYPYRAGGLPQTEVYSDNGLIVEEEWAFNNMVGREGGLPARVQYFEDETRPRLVYREFWYVDGKPGREGDLPPVVERYNDGDNSVVSESWVTAENVNILSREGDLPAKITYYYPGKRVKDETWYVGGEFSRQNDLPTKIAYNPNGSKEYELWLSRDGAQHRLTGPAVIRYFDTPEQRVSSEHYLINDKMQSSNDNPAVIRYFDTPEHGVRVREWYDRGELHREGAPARIEYSEGGEITTQEFYEDGVEVEDREFDEGNVDLCEETLKPLESNSGVMRERLGELMEICNQVEAPLDEDVVERVLGVLARKFETDDLTSIDANRGREFVDLLSLGNSSRILIPQNNLLVNYIGERGVDAGGLRRQFVSDAIGTVKHVLFRQLSVEADAEGIPRLYISQRKDEEILSDLGLGETESVPRLYEFAGALFAHMIMNQMNTDIPLSRLILWMMTSSSSVGAELLFYLLDSSSTLGRKLGTIEGDMMEEFEEYLQDTAREQYAEVVGGRLEAFLRGAAPVTDILKRRHVTPNELFQMSYQSISKEDFQNFLENDVEYTRGGGTPLSDDEKAILVDILMGVRDNNFVQLLQYWCGQKSIKVGSTYRVNVINVDEPKARSCFCGIDLPAVMLSVDPAEREIRETITNLFQNDLIFNTSFTTA